MIPTMTQTISNNGHELAGLKELAALGVLSSDSQILREHFVVDSDFLDGLETIARCLVNKELPPTVPFPGEPWLGIQAAMLNPDPPNTEQSGIDWGLSDIDELYTHSLAQYSVPVQIAIQGAVTVRMREIEKHTEQAGKKPGPDSQATMLVKLAENNARFFKAYDNKSYAIIHYADGHQETHPVRSKAFRGWLSKMFMNKYKSVPGTRGIEDAVTNLDTTDKPTENVYLRVGEKDGNLYVDLANDEWQCVEITPAGWWIRKDSPIPFLRSRGMKPLPLPEAGGSVWELFDFINVCEDDEPLILAWLLMAFHNNGPYPVMVVSGEQGSGKSVLTSMLRMIVDPNEGLLRADPDDIRDLMVSARNSRVITMENISKLPEWLSNAVCRLSTGGAFSVRELYSDQEETIFIAKRPTIINGIPEVATNADLLDRCLSIELPQLPDNERKPESTLFPEFNHALPRILGSLFDVLSSTLARVGSVKMDNLPRMADFAVWIEAASPALGYESGDLVERFKNNQRNAELTILADDELFTSIREFLTDRSNQPNSPAGGEFKGTASDLIREIRNFQALKRASKIPVSSLPVDNPRQMSIELKRLAPQLRRHGIHFEKDRKNKARFITLRLKQ